MNRSILIALVLLPLLIFGAEKAMGHAKRGGKEKLKSQQETQQKASPKLHNAQVLEVQDAKVSEIAPTLKEHYDNQIKQVKRTQFTPKLAFREVLEALNHQNETEYYADNHTWISTSELGEEVVGFLQTEVKAVLQANNPGKFEPLKIFSRCFSGYRFAVRSASEDKKSGTGWMIQDQGCTDRPLAKFEYDFTAGTVEVLVSEKLGKVSVQEFCKLYKLVVA